MEEVKFKIAIEKMGSDFCGTLDKEIEAFCFDTKQEANKALKKMAKDMGMKKSPISMFWNLSTSLQLRTNY